MAEYIEREAFIEDIKTEIINLALNGLKGTPRPHEELYDLIDRINEQPVADVVEVVRCKDCKHFGGVVTAYTCRLHSTGNTRIQMRENEFCSYGERRNDAIN